MRFAFCSGFPSGPQLLATSAFHGSSLSCHGRGSSRPAIPKAFALNCSSRLQPHVVNSVSLGPLSGPGATPGPLVTDAGAERPLHKAMPRVILRAGRLLCALVPIAFLFLGRANPAVAGTLGGLTAAWKGLDPAGFTAGLAASFVLVLASEIGDKTFFISALLSMKYSRTLVLVGTMLALGSMTVISVGIGQLFHALPASLNIGIPLDDYAAAALLVWFGFQNIRDGLAMSEEEEEELRDAEEVVEEAASKQKTGPSGLRVISETGSLVFLAEWGDKSMLATVALAAAKSPLGVIVGGISGHFVASILAVVGGSLLGKYISEKNARLVGGVLFWIFAILTIFNLF